MALLLAACGGSSPAGTTAVTHSLTQRESITVSSSVYSHSVTISTTHTTTSSSVATTHTHTPVAPPAASGPRVPATYTIGSSGSLTPPQISIPAGYRVQLTFIDNGSAAASVVVMTPHPLHLTAPAGGDASTILSGLKKGSYTVTVNGTVRGSLAIGSSPGP